MFLAKLDVLVYISLIVDKVELDEQGHIVSINGQPFDEYIQDTCDITSNKELIEIKQDVIKYYMC